MTLAVRRSSGCEFASQQKDSRLGNADDGCYIFRNEAAALGAAGARNCYKDLIYVVQAVGNLKTVSLEMRPFYHHRDEPFDASVCA